jgi:hypothetical protein
MYNFFLNPETMKKAAKEVRRFASEDELTMDNIQGLKYLNACFHESMRSTKATVFCSFRLLMYEQYILRYRSGLRVWLSLRVLCAETSFLSV